MSLMEVPHTKLFCSEMFNLTDLRNNCSYSQAKGRFHLKLFFLRVKLVTLSLLNCAGRVVCMSDPRFQKQDLNFDLIMGIDC